jgi:hypothetical protein
MTLFNFDQQCRARCGKHIFRADQHLVLMALNIALYESNRGASLGQNVVETAQHDWQSLMLDVPACIGNNDTGAPEAWLPVENRNVETPFSVVVRQADHVHGDIAAAFADATEDAGILRVGFECVYVARWANEVRQTFGEHAVTCSDVDHRLAAMNEVIEGGAREVRVLRELPSKTPGKPRVRCDQLPFDTYGGAFRSGIVGTDTVTSANPAWLPDDVMREEAIECCAVFRRNARFVTRVSAACSEQASRRRPKTRADVHDR